MLWAVVGWARVVRAARGDRCMGATTDAVILAMSSAKLQKIEKENKRVAT